MGYDAENLEPRAHTRIKFQKSHTESESQHHERKPPLLKAKSHANKSHLPVHTLKVDFYGCTQEIQAYSYESLLTNISEKYKLGDSSKYKIEVWSDLYKEWLHVVSLPPDNSRLQILLNENKHQKVLMNDNRFFSEKLNSNFKAYIDSDNKEFLNYFEKAVLFAFKRNEGNFGKKADAEALEQLKLENKRLMLDIENLNKRMTHLESRTNVPYSKGKRNCTII